MISALLLYVCASAAMDDCQVYVDRSWEGPLASVECDAYRLSIGSKVPLLYGQRGEYVTYVCDSQGEGV